MKRHIVAVLTLAATSLVLSVSNATLLDGGGDLSYVDVLDITWLHNPNTVAGSADDDGSFNTDGLMTGANAAAPVAPLVSGNFDDWGLASMSVAGELPTGSVDYRPRDDWNEYGGIFCATERELACRDNEPAHTYRYHLTPIGATPPVHSHRDLRGDQGLVQNIQTFHLSRTTTPEGIPGLWQYGFYGGAMRLEIRFLWR